MTRPRPLSIDDRPRTVVRRRTRRVLAAATLVGALAVGGTDVFLLTQGRASTEVGLDQVLQDFREQDAGEGAPVTDPGGPSAEPGPDAAADDAGTSTDVQTTDSAGPVQPTRPADDAPDAPGDPGSPDDAGTAPQAVDPATPADDPTDEPAQPASPTLALPQPGVYEYATSGYETVSFGSGRHDYPETTYASISHDGGCDYTVEHRWVEEHVERHSKCNQGTDLLGIATHAEVTFFGQTETSEIRCDPPAVNLRLGDAPDTTREFTCGNGDTTTHETITYLGEQTMVVGGVEVVAKHVLSISRIEGRSTGSSRHERWIHPEDGTVLRGIRHVESESQAFGTTVQYVEDVEYRLVSLTPRR